MSDEQLVDTMKTLTGGILRELQRRGYVIDLAVVSRPETGADTEDALRVQLRHPAVK